MKTPYGTILAASMTIFSALDAVAANACKQNARRSPECAFQAARGVLARFAGEGVADKFAFERMDADVPQAEVSARDGKILVRATDENRAAAAVGRYIREVAKGHWSRCGNRVPAEWPLPAKTLKVKSVLPHMHAYNYCVFSYSFAFYGKEEWRENIDRLAFSGFTSALVPTANMKVWQLFMCDAGFSEEQILDSLGQLDVLHAVRSGRTPGFTTRDAGRAALNALCCSTRRRTPTRSWRRCGIGGSTRCTAFLTRAISWGTSSARVAWRKASIAVASRPRCSENSRLPRQARHGASAAGAPHRAKTCWMGLIPN